MIKKNKIKKQHTKYMLPISLLCLFFISSCTTEQKQFKNVAETVIQGNENSIEGLFPGGVLFDYNNDGNLDIFLAAGLAEGRFLYKNTGTVNDEGFPIFEDESQDSGIKTPENRFKYAQGACYADIDNDGDEDLYILNEETISDNKDSNDGYNSLYLNNGDGTFTDIAKKAKVTDRKETGMSCSFADIDKDGYVDLYVANYIDANLFQLGNQSFLESKNRLFLNNGDLTFKDITNTAFKELRLNRKKEWLSFASCFSDYDNDNDPDLFIMNDRGPIQLFRNNGDKTFSDVSKESGLGISGGWRGCGIADVNNDGFQDIFATNSGGSWLFNRETMIGEMNLSDEIKEHTIWHGLFKNNGNGTFTDITKKSKTASDYSLKDLEEFFEGSGFEKHGIPSTLQSFEWGWGTFFWDYDLDTDQDLWFTTNYAMVGIIGNERKGAGPGRMLQNEGDQNNDGAVDFTDVTAERGLLNVDTKNNYRDGRVLLRGDINNDGFPDGILINSGSKMNTIQNRIKIYNRGTIGVFLNPGKSSGNRNNWIIVNTEGTISNRDGIGAKVIVTTPKTTQTKEVDGGSGLNSQHDKRLHFGLGKATKVDIKLLWPSGIEQELKQVAANQIITVREEREE